MCVIQHCSAIRWDVISPNMITNVVLYNIVHKCIIYHQNMMWFLDTHINVTSLMPIIK